MPRLLSLALLLILIAASTSAAQTMDTSSQQQPTPAPAPQQPAEPQKPKKVWTNDNLSDANGAVSVVGGNTKSKPKSTSSKPANEQYAASVRKQLEKLQQQIGDVDKQLVDLKNFSEGEPSTSASGIKLNQRYSREPIEVQIRALQEKRKDLQSKIDALLDEARKKGVEPGQLR